MACPTDLDDIERNVLLGLRLIHRANLILAGWPVPAELAKLPKKYNVIFVDAITNLASSSTEQSILSFFSYCKGLCGNGKSMILVAHSSAFDEGMLTRLRSLCDAHLRLYVENVRGKQVRTMEVSKVHNADQATGNVVSFNVEPGMGMRILPMSKAKA